MKATHVKVSKALLRDLLTLTRTLALAIEYLITTLADDPDSPGVDEVRFSSLALRDAIDELEGLLV